jgi:hypothetical protein
MSVYKKLQQARIRLQGTKLHKSGKNKFAGYEYFELADFLPAIQTICNDIGLCGVVSFTEHMAYLQINDTEDGTSIMFSSPMSSAALKGCHEVQNLGAVQTYLRRYLWTNAFEIVEHDALDATMGGSEPAKKFEPLAIKVDLKAKEEKTSKGWQIIVPECEGQDFLDSVKTCADMLLSICEKQADVKEMFKVNRTLFDKVKALDPAFYEDMVANFSKTKNSLKE